MFSLAKRNRVSIPFASVEEVRQAYSFSKLQDFLDIYYAVADVLRTEQDFLDLTSAYFDRAAEDAVRHAEIFFDPQTHTNGACHSLLRSRVSEQGCAPPRCVKGSPPS